MRRRRGGAISQNRICGKAGRCGMTLFFLEFAMKLLKVAYEYVLLGVEG